MKESRELNSIIWELLQDKEWHTAEEIQQLCEHKGIALENGRFPIYNVVHWWKKKKKIISNGKGGYKMINEFNKDIETHTTEDELKESIAKINSKLIEYGKFDWIRCSDTELQQARDIARELISLAERIQTNLI